MPRLGCLGANLPFTSASCPRRSPQPHSPLGLHPHFFHKVPCRFLAPLLYLGLHPRFFHKVLCHSDSLRAVSAPSRTCATSHPAAPHSLRAATAAMGTFLPKTQKNEHRSPGGGARFGLLSGRKRPVILMFQKPQPKKTERTSCAKRMRMNMARG